MGIQGVDLSRRFCEKTVLPIVSGRFPEAADRGAFGSFGNGSDTIGLDDDLSRDHHWSPRVNVLLPNTLYDEIGEDLAVHIRESVPESFEGFPVAFPRVSRGGVSVESFRDYFECFAKMEEPPREETDWFKTCEADLFHLVGGTVFQDLSGEFTRKREAFSYYPENIWKKKLADWLVYFTGSASPYNVNRCSRRRDYLSAELFFGLAIKRAMEICFLLNRTYAPYSKWLSRVLPTLPRLGSEVAEAIEKSIQTLDWHQRVLHLIEIAHLFAIEIHRLGLTGEPRLQGYSENFGDLTLYDSALQLYESIPEEILHGKFNEGEWWEVLVREVLVEGDERFPQAAPI